MWLGLKQDVEALLLQAPTVNLDRLARELGHHQTTAIDDQVLQSTRKFCVSASSCLGVLTGLDGDKRGPVICKRPPAVPILQTMKPLLSAVEPLLEGQRKTCPLLQGLSVSLPICLHAAYVSRFTRCADCNAHPAALIRPASSPEWLSSLYPSTLQHDTACMWLPMRRRIWCRSSRRTVPRYSAW